MATVVSGKVSGRAAGGWALLTALLTLLVILNYADRGAIAIAAPKLKDELHLNAFHFGIAVSAFAWVYAPSQFAVGWLTDRVCVYRLIAIGLALWAISTMLTAAATGLAVLVALRLCLGLGEGVAFPAASKIIARHVPAERRGMANGALASALAIGPALGTLAGGLILASCGWRAIFLVFGAVTLLWIVPWHFASRGHRQLLAERTPSVPMRNLLHQPVLWTMGIGHFANTYSFFFLLAWLPLYLVKQRGFTIVEMTAITSSVYAVQAVGALVFGWFSDWVSARGFQEGQVRKALMAYSMAMAAAAVFGLAYASSTSSLIFWLMVFAIGAGPGGSNCYAIAQMFAGPRASGSWVGAMNGIGNCSGIVGPLMTGAIIDGTGSYLAAFLLAGTISSFGALWWWFVIPRVEPIAGLADNAIATSPINERA